MAFDREQHETLRLVVQGPSPSAGAAGFAVSLARAGRARFGGPRACARLRDSVVERTALSSCATAP